MNPSVRRALFAVIVVGIALLLLPRSRRAPGVREGPPAAAGSATAVDRPSSAPGLSPLGRPLARERAESGSLDGTEVAGGLVVDADGNFYPSPEAVELFDYFLSTTGEKPDEEIVERIRAEIRRRLSEPAEAQALAFLDRYLLYRERGIALAATDAADEDLRARFDRLRALRREVFGEEIAARLFGEEELAADVTLRQREVALDPTLTDAEKAQRIESLYSELPAPMREARARTLAAAMLRADEERIRGEGGSDEDIRALRVQRFGEEAADRLEDLDRRRAEWSTRLEAFRGERARILADAALNAEERSAAIARLLADSFDEGERIRVEALDRLATENGSR